MCESIENLSEQQHQKAFMSELITIVVGTDLSVINSSSVRMLQWFDIAEDPDSNPRSTMKFPG